MYVYNPPVGSVQEKYLQLYKTPEERAMRLYVSSARINTYTIDDHDVIVDNNDYFSPLDSIIGYARNAFTLKVLKRILTIYNIQCYEFNTYEVSVYESKGVASSSGMVTIKFFALLFLAKRGEEICPEELPFELSHIDSFDTTDAITNEKYDREEYANHSLWLQRHKA